MIEKILNKIDEYECICLYRHVNPDYDAFGSQFGMYDLIQNTFENKSHPRQALRLDESFEFFDLKKLMIVFIYKYI